VQVEAYKVVKDQAIPVEANKQQDLYISANFLILPASENGGVSRS
jgi:hypothetical protein